MQKIKKKLTVGKEKAGLDLYCSLKMDGKEVKRFRSRSFLGSFAWMIHALMHSGEGKKLNLVQLAATWQSSHRSNNRLNRSEFFINSANEETPMEIDLGSATLLNGFVDKDDQYSNYIHIIGTEDYNGVYKGVKTGSSTVELYHLDGTPVDGSIGSSPVDGMCNPAIGFIEHDIKNTNSSDSWPLYNIQNWQVVVGRSNRAVSVDDVGLFDQILHGEEVGELSHGGISTSEIFTDKPTSRFTISKPFTNLTNETVEVSEIGIKSGILVRTQTEAEQGLSPGFTVVRDSLDSPLSIPSGKTLTVDYELVIRLTPDTQDTDSDGTNGGFLEKFMIGLRSLSRNPGVQSGTFFQCAASPGITSHSNNYRNTFRSNLFGIRVGDNNQFVSMTDTKLNLDDNNKNGYEHGSEDGELYHYGTDVAPVEYDMNGNKAIYEVSRIFENRGSHPIDVREIGLFANVRALSTNDSPVPELIARTALHPDDQFTIAPGEFKQVVYEVEVIA